MKSNAIKLSANSKKIFELLDRSPKPLSAYDIMSRLSNSGIKAPPTVYRALDSLKKHGLIHKIESLNAFTSCHNKCKEHKHEHAYQFAVCSKCGVTIELHSHRLIELTDDIAAKLGFHVEREIIELIGLCKACSKRKS